MSFWFNGKRGVDKVQATSMTYFLVSWTCLKSMRPNW